MKKISAVILNYNSTDYTIKCISSLNKYNVSVPLQIIVVDNNSSEDEKKKLKEYQKLNPSHIYIYSLVNKGYSAGNNLGVEKAIQINSNAVLIINPDVEVSENAVNQMYSTLENNENCIMVGPKIIDEKYETDINAQRFKTQSVKSIILTKYPINKMRINFLNEYFGRNRNFDVGCEVVTTSGCCVMFSTEYFKIYGLFDEDFFLFSEEVIWGFNISKDPKLIAYYNPNSVVVHSHPKIISKTKYITFINKMKSDIRFAKKYLRKNNAQLIVVYLYYLISYSFFFIFDSEYRQFRKDFKSSFRDLMKLNFI